MNRNEDLSENVNYTSKELPVLTSDEHLSELATYRELMHWHPDYEFLLIKDGVMDLGVEISKCWLQNNLNCRSLLITIEFKGYFNIK